MGQRDKSRDPGGFKKYLTRFKWLWDFFQAIPWLRRIVNALLLNNAIEQMPFRPEPYCNGTRGPDEEKNWDYTTWEGLTNRRWASRHLPPAAQGGLPDATAVANDLFSRKADGFQPSIKSSLLFPYFAQWFVDGFLVTDAVDRRRNLSNHQIDLCQLYGLHPEVTELIREKSGGRLKSQQIDGKGEFAPFLFENGEIKPEYCIRRSGYRGFADIGQSQIFVDRNPPPGPREVGFELMDKNLRTAVNLKLEDGTEIVMPRHLVYQEIPRREELYLWKKYPKLPHDPTIYEKVFAIANDRGNSTFAFTLMSTLMLREHNRIAGILDSSYGWDDERTFQTTRNVMIVILLKIVVDEYINHIAPYHFKLFVDPEKFFKPFGWKWTNWMTVEFQLLYQWHTMIPDELNLGNGKTITSEQSLWNPGMIVDEGLANMFQHASNQPAGRIGARNTWQWLIDNAEVPSIEMGRMCQLKRYNDYRELCNMPCVTAFNQITGNEEVQETLARHYGKVDNIEFYPGLFCEDVRDNSALAPLVGTMVSVDAFSQALTNPLLQKRIFNKDTFSPKGWEIVNEAQTMDALLKRNTPELSSSERDAISISMTRKNWKRV